MSYHTVIVVGNVGRDPELRYTPTGQPVCNFSVATTRQYTTSGGEHVKETVWFRVAAWGKQAEIVNQWLRKGNKVLVEGTLTPDKGTGNPRIWTNNGTGASQTAYELKADKVRFLERAEGGNGNGNQQHQEEYAVVPLGEDEEVPF